LVAFAALVSAAHAERPEIQTRLALAHAATAEAKARYDCIQDAKPKIIGTCINDLLLAARLAAFPNAENSL